MSEQNTTASIKHRLSAPIFTIWAIVLIGLIGFLSERLLFQVEVNSMMLRYGASVTLAYIIPGFLARFSEVRFWIYLKRTWLPFAIVLVVAIGTGWYMQDNCPQAVSIGEYRDICIEQNLDISKNYERRFQPPIRGQKYPVDLYKQGYKEMAFHQAEITCRIVNDICAFYVREMPDNPQMPEILDLANKSCYAPHKDLWGLNNCGVLGAYYYSIGKTQEALKLWDYACQKNSWDACRMIVGAHVADPEGAVQAYKSFCGAEPKDQLTKRVYSRFCENQNGKDIPTDFVKNSESILREFLAQQQKVKN